MTILKRIAAFIVIFILATCAAVYEAWQAAKEIK